MEIVELELDKIKPYEKNAKEHPEEQVQLIANSIKEFGFKTPIVVDEEFMIIQGHGRRLASLSLGLKTVPCVVADDLSKEQVKMLRLADNKVAESEWDEDFLNEELLNLVEDFTITDFGFEFELPNEYDEEDADTVPEIEENPVIKRGDIIELGMNFQHRVMCGDSTSEDDVVKLMDGNKADMVFTDPPYGVEYEGGHNKKKRGQIENDALHGQDLTDLFYEALNNAVKYTHNHAPFYIWYASGKSVETFKSFQKLPLSIRAIVTWYKINSGLGAFMAQYIPNYEPCIYAHKTGKSIKWYGATNEKTVWELKRDQSNNLHPTQKPVELPERAINNSSKPKDIVIDLFGGSGSTLIAGETLTRYVYTMEFDPQYAQVIIQRYCDYTSIDTIKINGEEVSWEEYKNNALAEMPSN